MDIEWKILRESYLLRLYLHEYIDRIKPIVLDYQIKIHSQRGYIETGHNGKDFPSFEIWKKIREIFPKCPIKEVAQLFDIPSRILNTPLNPK